MKKLSIIAMMRLFYFLGPLATMVLILTALGSVESVHAAEFFCSSGNVTCLIAAINEANTHAGADTINLDPGTYTLTTVDNSDNGLPSITSDITINGEDASTTIIERDPGASAFRIFTVTVTGKLTINGLSIKRGFVFTGGGINNLGTLNVNDSIFESNLGNDAGAILNSGTLTLSRTFLINNQALAGGGIDNRGTASIISSSIIDNFGESGGGVSNGGTMTIKDSTISDNLGDGGGGILNGGMMTITNSTIANNFLRMAVGGAGIFNLSGTLSVINSTISGNSGSPTNRGGGILNDTGGIAELQNSILALNTAGLGSGPSDCVGPITSRGNNLIGDLSGCDISLLANDIISDPGLGAFTDNETPGNGHFPLLETSRAIDKGNNYVCSTNPVLATDQIGQPRVGVCDIGSVEFQRRMLVSIDIRPNSDANKINPNSTKDINVAILSLNGFDATTVDPNTVRFGATGTEAAPVHVAQRDVDGDGNRDMVLRFAIPDTGIMCGDTSASLSGQTSQGLSIIGSSPIKTVQCKQQNLSRN